MSMLLTRLPGDGIIRKVCGPAQSAREYRRVLLGQLEEPSPTIGLPVEAKGVSGAQNSVFRRKPLSVAFSSLDLCRVSDGSALMLAKIISLLFGYG